MCFNGATARRPWRTDVLCCLLQYYASASMGPRHEDRGERQCDVLRLHCVCSGFNGATARRPWKTSCGEDGGADAKGFNGATARRPWKTRRSRKKIDYLRAFNGATARSRGEPTVLPITYLPAFSLQWGHGTKTVENTLKTPFATAVSAASMGPRHEDRGEHVQYYTSDYDAASFNGATARRPWRTRPRRGRGGPNGRASMGPRHEDRGELHRPFTAWATSVQLQWGHGTKTVENCVPVSRFRWTCSGFNGATARRPWRTSAVLSKGNVL